MKRCFATIVSPNYLAYARVLGESLARLAPEGAYRVLVVGRREPQADAAFREAGLDVMYATDLELPDFEQLAFRFDLLELNTALKPTFLKKLFTQGFDEVVYLDPDIRLYAPPIPVFEALKVAQIALIPHALSPVMDGRRPSDIDFLRSGTFNLGFVGLRRGPESMALLDWWERRCLSHGFSDQGFGTFVDQKWMDLAPCYFDSVAVLKHRGCNVAYWNLHERTLAWDGQAWRVGGTDLIFFHFSGIDASKPQTLSKYQNRHAIEAGSPVANLVAEYCQLLLAAGHARWKDLSYPFGALDDGTPITPLMRRAANLSSVSTADPFNPGSVFQRELRGKGLGRRAAPGLAKTTTVDFDPTDRRVRLVNGLIRLGARIVGAETILLLLRFATFLTWQSNYTAVLLDKPFDLEHRDRRD